MMKQAILTLLGLAIVGALSGSPVQPQGETERLMEKADAVLVASAQSGWRTGNSVSLWLLVARSIKGPLNRGDVVKVSWATAVRSFAEVKGQYGIWFLRTDQEGDWTLLSITNSRVPLQAAFFELSGSAVPIPPIDQSAPGTASDLVAEELGAALPYYKGPLQLHLLATGLRGIANSSSPHRIYESLRSSSDAELKFIALAGLISEGDRTALAEVSEDISAAADLTVGGAFVADAVRSLRDSDSGTVLALGKIASSRSDQLRSSAAQALAYIHTRETMPFLAQLLDAPDAGSRQSAMLGMSRFVCNLPVATEQATVTGRDLVPQGPAPYRTRATDDHSLATRQLDANKEAEYLGFWRAWWDASRQTVMGGDRR